MGVHVKQLDWIANIAIMTIPRGYDVIFVSHIPFVILSGKTVKPLSNVVELIEALNLKKSGNIGNVSYVFTEVGGVKILMCLSGHLHYDSQIYRNGVLYVTTAADAAYENYKMDPFVKDLSGRKRGTINEQCFDCFTIS